MADELDPFAELIPDEPEAQPALPTGGFTAHMTGYHPVDPVDPNYQMEGGRYGAEEWHGKKLPQPERLFTLDQYRRGQAPYVSVAMDNSKANPYPYGTFLYSPQFPDVPFKVMDTGEAFNGKNPRKWGEAKGTSRIDIARDNNAGANSQENNGPAQFFPATLETTEIEKAQPAMIHELEVRRAQMAEPNGQRPTPNVQRPTPNTEEDNPFEDLAQPTAIKTNVEIANPEASQLDDPFEELLPPEVRSATPVYANETPEGSPGWQDMMRARPLLASQIPAASAQAPTFEESMMEGLPRAAAPEVQPPRRIPGDYNSVQEAYGEAAETSGAIGGTLNALDWAMDQPIIPQDQARQLARFAGGGAVMDYPQIGPALDRVGDELSDLSKPKNVAAMALLKAPVARALFTGQLLDATAEDIQAMRQAYDKGDHEELARAIAGTVMHGGMAGLGLAEIGGARLSRARDGFQRGAIMSVETGPPVFDRATALPEGGERNAETVRSNTGSPGQGGQTGQPQIQIGPGQGRPYLQLEAPKPAGGQGKVAPEPVPAVQTPGELEIERIRGSIAEREKLLATEQDPDERLNISSEIRDLRIDLQAAQEADITQKKFEHAWTMAGGEAARSRFAYQLRALGYGDDEIAAMSPQQAREAVKRPATAVPEGETDDPFVDLVPDERLPNGLKPGLDLETVLTGPGARKDPVGRLQAAAIKELGLTDYSNPMNFSKENDRTIAERMLEIAQTHPDFDYLFEFKNGYWTHRATGARIAGPRETAQLPEILARKAEEEKARREYDEEMQNDLHGNPYGDQGYELLESISDLGGLPGKGGLHRPAWKGELGRIQDLVAASRKMGAKLPKGLFSKGAHDVDGLVRGLRERGFDIERPQDLFDVLENRIVQNKPHYANPEAGLENYGGGVLEEPAKYISPYAASYLGTATENGVRGEKLTPETEGFGHEDFGLTHGQNWRYYPHTKTVMWWGEPTEVQRENVKAWLEKRGQTVADRHKVIFREGQPRPLGFLEQPEHPYRVRTQQELEAERDEYARQSAERRQLEEAEAKAAVDPQAVRDMREALRYAEQDVFHQELWRSQRDNPNTTEGERRELRGLISAAKLDDARSNILRFRTMLKIEAGAAKNFPPLPPLDYTAGSKTSRWDVIEQGYKRAKAAQEALPGVPFKNIRVIGIMDSSRGPMPDQMRPIAEIFVRRQDMHEASERLNKQFPPGDRNYTTYNGSVGLDLMNPKSGEPTYKEWLRGARPPADLAERQAERARIRSEEKARDKAAAAASAERRRQELERLALQKELRERPLLPERSESQAPTSMRGAPPATKQEQLRLLEQEGQYMASAKRPLRAVIVGCGKAKANSIRKAEDLYTGSLTRARIRYAQRSGQPWLILSAKHGILAPETDVAPYDTAITDLDASQKAKWQANVIGQLTQFAQPFENPGNVTFEIHAGDDYRKLVTPLLRQLGFNVEEPTKGQGIGTQLSGYSKGQPAPRLEIPPAHEQMRFLEEAVKYGDISREEALELAEIYIKWFLPGENRRRAREAEEAERQKGARQVRRRAEALHRRILAEREEDKTSPELRERRPEVTPVPPGDEEQLLLMEKGGKYGAKYFRILSGPHTGKVGEFAFFEGGKWVLDVPGVGHVRVPIGDVRKAKGQEESGQLELAPAKDQPFNLRGEQLTSEVGAEGAARAKAQAESEQKRDQMTLFETPPIYNPDPRAIRAVALQDDKGNVYPGEPYETHTDLQDRLEQENAEPYRSAQTYDDGFVTHAGEFLDRKQAWKRAGELGQLSRTRRKQSALSEQIEMASSEVGPVAGVTQEDISQFVDKAGVRPQDKAQAQHEISETIQLAADPELQRAYELPEQAELFGAGTGTAPSELLRSGRPTGGRSGRPTLSGPEQAEAWRQLERGNAQAVGDALRNNRNRLSIIIPELVRGESQGFDIRGSIILTPADFAMAVQTIRSPWKESLKVVAVDRDGHVLGSEIVHVGTLNESLAHPRDLFRLFALLKERFPSARLLMSHNHPSGDPHPSAADQQLITQLDNTAQMAGTTILDHVITNGGKFWSSNDARNGGYVEAGMGEIPRTMQPWEIAPADLMPALNNSFAFSEMARTLRNDDPGAAHIFYVGTRYKVNAIERVSLDLPDRVRESGGGIRLQRLEQAITAGIARNGAYGILLDLPEGKWPEGYKGVLDRVADAVLQMRAKVLDARWPGMESANVADLIPARVAVPSVREEGPHYAAGAPPKGGPPPKGKAPVPPVHQPTPASSPAVSGAIAPLQQWWKHKTAGIRKLMAPQTIDEPALNVANIIRHYNAEGAQIEQRADKALAVARADFDRTPVPNAWKYQAGQPLPRNYQFIDQYERFGAGLSPADRQLKATIAQINRELVDLVHNVDPDALQTLISDKDYFPRLWKDPDQARKVFAEILSHRPLLGPRGFLKQRTINYFIDGIRAGLQPVSDNPIDLELLKMHEILRFTQGKKMVQEIKARGWRRFVYAYERPPDGWRTRRTDAVETVYAPPFVTVPEAYDEQLRVKTIEFLDKLGVPHERLAKMRGERWGEASRSGIPPGKIRTRFAGPMSVYWHELGHVLQYRYGWVDQVAYDAKRANLGGNSAIEKELRDLADARSGQPRTKGVKPTHFQRYIRTKDEKAAVMLEAYLHAPEMMKRTAPTIYSRVRQFIKDHPELHELEDIRPSVQLGTDTAQIPINGMVVLGHWYYPEGAAQVLDNYTSLGLQRFNLFRQLRTASNVLNGLQLGFSAFHAGFTTIEQMVSTFALGVNYLGAGDLGKGLGRMVASPLSPVAKYYTGKAVQTAMLDPKWAGKVKVLGKDYQLAPAGEKLVNEIANLAVKGGLRAAADPFWRTAITRNLMRAWHEGGTRRFTGTIWRLPFAISEQMMRPILEYLVPRQKLGAFAELAKFYMDRLGPGADVTQIRAAMARAADAVEDRMGQMTYDNLFYNRVMRDLALIGFRAYGWQLGKYRGLAGGIRDTLTTPGRVAKGGELVTPRMAYLIALPLVAGAIGAVMNYLMTGEPPRDWRDMLMPRTGRLDRSGSPQRLSLPTYVKDLLSDWRDFPNIKKMLQSASHKLNPMIPYFTDLMLNADFWNTKIYDEDDPYLKQAYDVLQYTLRTAAPFSVTNTARLLESHPTLMQQVLPYFGFVPAKRELTMTPAQLKAAEIIQASFPQGARNQDQAERSRTLATFLRDMKEQDPEWANQLTGGILTGKLRPQDVTRVFQALPLSPLQYQVKKMEVKEGMKVWDLANDQERLQLRPILIRKVGGAKTLTPAERIRYFNILSGSHTQAGAEPAAIAA